MKWEENTKNGKMFASVTHKDLVANNLSFFLSDVFLTWTNPLNVKWSYGVLNYYRNKQTFISFWQTFSVTTFALIKLSFQILFMNINSIFVMYLLKISNPVFRGYRNRTMGYGVNRLNMKLKFVIDILAHKSRTRILPDIGLVLKYQ